MTLGITTFDWPSMPAVINIQNWLQMEKKARERLHNKATKIVQARAKKIFDEAVKLSPQWSGDFAANWTIETNLTGSTGYVGSKKVHPWTDLQWWDTGADSTLKERKALVNNTAYAGKLMAKYAGASEAIALAQVLTYARISTIKWNTKIKLVNHSPTADIIESSTVHLRNVNLIPGSIGVITHLKTKYPNILG